MKIVAVIPAKGHSERLPRKNIATVRGKPMLYWAVQACKGSKHNIDVWVSTEDSEIASLAKQLDAHVHDRPRKLANDSVAKQEVIREATHSIIMGGCDPDIVVSLQPNSPQITTEILDAAIDKFIDADVNEIFSVGLDMLQNGAFRIMKTKYVFSRDLSTHCGVYVCDLIDVHTQTDLERVEKHV